MVRPWYTVHMYDVAENAGSLAVCFWIPEAAIRIVAFGGKSKGQIELVRWKAKSVFLSIRQDVEASLPKVSILGSVIDSMIVVPEGTSILSIGVVVVFILSRIGGIVRPSIERGSTVRAVKVYTISKSP